MIQFRLKFLLSLLFVAISLSYYVFYICPFVRYAWNQSYDDFSVNNIEYLLTRDGNSHSGLLQSNVVVPKILHQMWINVNIPPQWMTTRAMCKRVYSDFECVFWTNADLRNLIVIDYSWFSEIYDSYSYDIQRADASRY